MHAVATALSLRRLIYLLRRHTAHPGEGLWESVWRAALGRFLPPVVRDALESELAKAGIQKPPNEKASGLADIFSVSPNVHFLVIFAFYDYLKFILFILYFLFIFIFFFYYLSIYLFLFYIFFIY
jgi:hypothetical protein